MVFAGTSKTQSRPPITLLYIYITLWRVEHFKDDLRSFGNGDDASTIYKALRRYNSGQVNESNLSDAQGAFANYVSDIANRLQGRTNSD